MFEDGGYIFYDGAMGTILQANGLKRGERPDAMCITAADVVEKIHRMYVDAGSDIICTNTFGANAIALARTGYSPEAIITAAISAAKRAADGRARVALDIGPLGDFTEPVGSLTFERAYELFKQQAVCGESAGADLAAIETMSDVTELRAAILAVTENTNLPVFATMTFGKNGRTYLGVTPEEFVTAAEDAGATAIGLNCSLEPAEMFETAERIAAASKLPLIIKPNAGLPDSQTGVYNMTPAEFAADMAKFAKLGVKVVGGCCGTTPEYIAELKKTFLTLTERS